MLFFLFVYLLYVYFFYKSCLFVIVKKIYKMDVRYLDILIGCLFLGMFEKFKFILNIF